MSGASLILHHYDFSNFSEKIRLVLGRKALAWHSVTIPAYAPKPDYTPLTAGYRRTPALQIGADVYCDTRLIVEQLERVAPAPAALPADRAQRAECEMLVEWAEGVLFRPVALYITGLHAERFPAAFHADRAVLHGKAPPSVAQVHAAAKKYRAQVDALLARLEALFADGREWALPGGPGLADFALYETPWFLRTIGGDAALPATLEHVAAWSARVAAIGHGEPTPLAAGEALTAARAAEPEPLAAQGGAVPEGLACGEAALVSAFDQAAMAQGTLAAVDAERITLACEDPRTGRVHVHFPRLGYRLGRPRS